MSNFQERAQSLFLSAFEIEGDADLASFLTHECGKDIELRAEVEDLLAHAKRLGSFLAVDESPLRSLEENTAAEKEGDTVGQYRLLQRIGEGGFGVVYLAEQERPVRRQVALKIVKPGMDSREVVARFETERQALALMDHPNIAKVFDAGTSYSGRPYFVMELVKGVSITEYCDTCSMTTRQRLELFIATCQAVQHAHQKGVIHRDIKPSNVLITLQDGVPTPKVIDFGVAKAIGHSLTEHSLTNAFTQMIGTPMYMSPEQAELSPLGVDTRSDIYSLGVLLYELVTSTTPLDKALLRGAPLDEIRRAIREEEPPRPSTRLSTLNVDVLSTLAERHRTEVRRLVHSLRGELDWIVMKCLEKDRSRRYPTANALAMDVYRHLNDDPVEARPPSHWYRMSKFFLRNKAGVAVGAAVAALLIGTIWILLASNSRIRHEAGVRNQALIAKDAALTTAQDAVDRLLTQVASERFRDMPLSHPLRIALMEDALKFYDRLAKQSGGNSSLRQKVANLHHLHAGLLREVGDFQKAVEALRQSRDVWRVLAEDDPSPPTMLMQLARLESDLAFTLHQGNESILPRNTEALTQYVHALELSDEIERAWPGKCEPDLLSRRMLAKAKLHRGENAEAMHLWQSAITLGERYVASHPGFSDTAVEVGWTCVHLHDALSGQTDFSVVEADDVLKRGLAAVGPAIVGSPPPMRAADVRAGLNVRLAALRCRQDRADEAWPLFREAIAEIQRLCEGSPRNADYWNSMRWFYQEYAMRLADAKQQEAARGVPNQLQQWLDGFAPKANEPAQKEQVRLTELWIKDLRDALEM